MGGLAAWRRAGALRKGAAFLGALALLVQLWLPLLHQPGAAMAGQSQAYTRMAAFYGGKLVLCAASAKDPSGGTAPAPSHKPPPCPTCLTLQGLESFIPPAPITIAASPRQADPPDMIGTAPIIARSLDPTSQPRAPPSA
jgi:hypothetical protein